MKITTLNVQHLRKYEFLKFMKDVIHIVEEKEIETKGIYPALDLFYSDYALMIEVRNKPSYKSMTNKLQVLNKERDTLIRGLWELLKGWSILGSSLEKEMAILLVDCCKKYWGTISKIQRCNYNEKTSNINLLLGVFTKEEASIEAIGLLPNVAGYVEQLEIVNTKFAVLYKERTKAFAKDNPLSFNLMRKRVEKGYLELKLYLEYCYVVHKSPKYKEVISYLNVIVVTYRAELRRRKTLAKKRKAKAVALANNNS